MHFSHFHWLLQVEAFGAVLHFWWHRIVHTLHLTETTLERKAANHLAHSSLELLASTRDKPWFKRDFNDGVGREGEVSGWVDECLLADAEGVQMAVPDSIGENEGSCGSSGIYRPTVCAWKVTDIILGWICTMVS